MSNEGAIMFSIRTQKHCFIVVAIIVHILANVSLAADPPRLNDLYIKATHNSYACCGGSNWWGYDNTCPVMHNPPYQQIDDWGVWALELDFGVIEGGI